MTDLHAVHRGAGPPMVLLHGLGSHWALWRPLLGPLSRGHHVMAVDLPGFGASPPLPASTRPTAAALAAAVADWLADQGLAQVDVVGHSLGGWVALELAKRGRARSVTALAPAGLWRDHHPVASYAALWATHRLATLTRGAAPVLLRHPWPRTVGLAAMFARPWRVPAEDAAEMARAYADAPGFAATLAAAGPRRFTGGRRVGVPVTVAVCERDLVLLPWQNSCRDQLPSQTRWVRLAGCGHVPVYDDPARVVDLVEQTAATG